MIETFIMGSTNKNSVGKHYFEGLYQQNADPWAFSSSAYEREKYQHTLQALPERRYQHALEIGCSIGVFTELLSPLCNQILAVDLSPTALKTAEQRLKGNPNVRFSEGQVPAAFPSGTFDLILFCEIGYYLSEKDLLETRSLILNALPEGGVLSLVHWRPVINGCPLTGDEVHDFFLKKGLPLSGIYERQNDAYRMNVFEKQFVQ